MLHSLISKFDSNIETADAHCDIPCGIYDPRIVTYYAVSALRQIDILLSLKDKGLSETGFAMQVEPGNQDDMAKAHELAHGIMLAGSAVRQDLHREDGEKLVDLTNQFAEMFWASKGVKTKKVKTPYAPGVEVVEPDL